jgi:hypothetical protein
VCGCFHAVVDPAPLTPREDAIPEVWPARGRRQVSTDYSKPSRNAIELIVKVK